MLASIISLDLSLVLQFVFTALVFGLGLLYAVKATASRYFVVDARFDGGGAVVSDDREIPVGGAFSDIRPMADSDSETACIICGSLGEKKCSRCKSVRYWYVTDHSLSLLRTKIGF